MKFEDLLNHVSDALLTVKRGGKKEGDRRAAQDRGILDVALMIAAMDGEIQPAEVSAYYRLLAKCHACLKADASAVLDAALHKAGYLIARKQMGTEVKGCLAAFVREATAALPEGFVTGSLADLRRAFAFWMTMVMADGAYASIEREAIEALAKAIARVRKEAGFPQLEADFLDRVAVIVKDLSNSVKRAKAQAALDALVQTVEQA